MDESLKKIISRLERLERHCNLESGDKNDLLENLLASLNPFLQEGEEASAIISALVEEEVIRRKKESASLCDQLKVYEKKVLSVSEHQKLPDEQRLLFEYDLMMDNWQLLDDWLLIAEDYDKEKPEVAMLEWLDERKKRMAEEQASIWVSLGK